MARRMIITEIIPDIENEKHTEESYRQQTRRNRRNRRDASSDRDRKLPRSIKTLQRRPQQGPLPKKCVLVFLKRFFLNLTLRVA